MANTKISALGAGAVAAAAVLAGVTAGGVTSKFTLSDIATGVHGPLRPYGEGTFAWSAGAATADLSAHKDYRATNTLSSASNTLTGSNAATGMEGSFTVKQDATGSRVLVLDITGATLIDDDDSDTADVDIATAANAESTVWYQCYTAPGGSTLTCRYGSSPSSATLTADIANALKSATTTVSVSAATAPSSGQALVATSSTAATWQTISSANYWDTLRVLEPLRANALGDFVLTSARTYAVYIGYFSSTKVIKYVEFVFNTNGAGTQTAEVALASSPLAPNKTAQTLTKLSADGTLDDLTTGATDVKRNTTALNSGSGYTVAAGTHVWALIRTAMGTTQPRLIGSNLSWGHGYCMTADAVGALTSMTTASFSPATGSGTVECPYLVLTMD